MKNRKRLLMKVFCIVGLAFAICLSAPVFEYGTSSLAIAKSKDKKKTDDKKKKARDEYEKAQKEWKKKEWKKVISHLQKAIKQDKTPASDYYPYAMTGFAYFKLGNTKNAQKYCEKSQSLGGKGWHLNQCLKALTPSSKPEPTAAPKPTAIPKAPEPAAPEPAVSKPGAPDTQADAPPTITVLTEIPQTTQAPQLKITGMVSDDLGLNTFDIQVSKPDSRLLAERPKVRMVDKMFEASLPLDIGQNVVIITAIDTSGQGSQKEFLVTRLEPPQQQPPDTRATSPEVAEGPGGPGGPGRPGRPKRGKVYAVVVGIGAFQDSRIPPLRFTVPDAQGFYDVLTDPNYGGVPQDHVKLLLDEGATYQSIKSAIGSWLPKNAREDDTVIIYYSGHGAPENNKTYWVTHNANIDDLYATALNNNEISDMLDEIESKRILTFLDSCYSAATVNRSNQTRDVMVEIPWDQFMGEGKVTISASNGKQLSLELESYGHGVFTYYLLKGMQGEADGMAGVERDGMIEVEELWNFVRSSVTDAAKKRGNTQTPVLQGSLTAGIPITYDLAYLEELHQKRQQATQEKQAKLQGFFEQGQIKPGHFDCAFGMLEHGHSDGYLDGLLTGELSPATFTKLFKCKPPPSQ